MKSRYAFLLALCATSACFSPARAQAPAMPQPMMPPPPPSMMPAMSAAQLNTPGPNVKVPADLKVSGVAAVVNGQKITNQDLLMEYLKDGGQPTLDELINRVLVNSAASKAHITASPVEIEGRLKEAKQFILQQYPGFTWAQFLQSQGRSEYYLRQNIKLRLLAEKLVAKNLPAPSLAGKVHLYHILMLTQPVPGHATAHTDADAQAQIVKIAAQIKAGTITFQDAAKKYSEDSTASSGGDLGWQGPDSPLDPAFKDAAMKLKAGEVSAPVKSQFGWHLIYAAKLGADATPAEAVAAGAPQQLQQVRQLLPQYLEQLKDTAKITNYLIPVGPKVPPQRSFGGPQPGMPSRMRPTMPMPRPGQPRVIPQPTMPAPTPAPTTPTPMPAPTTPAPTAPTPMPAPTTPAPMPAPAAPTPMPAPTVPATPPANP